MEYFSIQLGTARLYGSRAKGNFTSRSDIDLALLGEIDRHTLSAIALDLDESDLPHAVDVLCLAHLRNRALIDHIERVGVEIYTQ